VCGEKGSEEGDQRGKVPCGVKKALAAHGFDRRDQGEPQRGNPIIGKCNAGRKKAGSFRRVLRGGGEAQMKLKKANRRQE